MDKLKTTTNGPSNGEVTVSSAENAALLLMCAGLLTVGTLRLKNVPMLADVRTTQKLLQGMGTRVLTDNVYEFEINGGAVNNTCAPYELVKIMRASILVLGPTLARFSEAQTSLLGGCAIGPRPVDQHLEGFEIMGAEIIIEHGYVKAEGHLKGTRIVMDVVTVGGTGDLLMATTLVEGTTVLENYAIEPEVIDLAECLIRMGAKISGIGIPVMIAEGVEELYGYGHNVIPDRIEADIFLCTVAMAGGKVVLCRAAPKTMEAALEKLTETGAVIEAGDDWIPTNVKQRPKVVDIRTVVHPGFPIDMQVQFMAINAIAEGSCRAVRIIFENRFMHVPGLNRMGANIITKGNTAYIKGVETLLGATVTVTNLRASASLVVAGLIVGDEIIVKRIYHLDRGCEHIGRKPGRVDAKTERVSG